MVTLFRSPLSSGARVVKRASDLFIATLALVILSPLWLLLALLIKLDSSGPVFYKQERVGMDGRIFLFYKFRSMQVGSDDASHREYQRAYISGRAESNLGDDERPVFKLRADTRITRVGRTATQNQPRRVAATFQRHARRHERRRPQTADSVRS
jgi:lipopolysaccharide/colanic/teichoic acid biosynthesis glycosyltransferase